MQFKIPNSKFSLHCSLFTALLLFTVLSGCGSSVTGTNTALDVTHKGAPDCTQSGCHPGFGAGGTVFSNLSSTATVSGVTVKAQSVSTGSTITLGTADSLGNFHYNTALSGFYNMAVSSKPWSGAHDMPTQSGCNRCHKWLPAGGANGKLN